MKIKTSCPLGHKCRDLVKEADEVIENRCMWLVTLKGKDPNSNENIDREECAMVANVLYLTETNKNIIGVIETTEALRKQTMPTILPFLLDK